MGNIDCTRGPRPRRFVAVAVTAVMLAAGLAAGGGPAAAQDSTEVQLVELDPIILDIDGDILSGTDLSDVRNLCGSATSGDVVLCIGGSDLDTGLIHDGSNLDVAGVQVNPLVASGGQAISALEWIVDEAVEAIPVLYDIPADTRIRAYARPEIQAYVHSRLLDIVDRYVYGVELSDDEQRAFEFLVAETISDDRAQAQAAYDEFVRFQQSPCGYSPPASPAFAESLPLPADVVDDCIYAGSSLLVSLLSFAPPTPSVEHFQVWGAHAVSQTGPFANLNALEFQLQLLDAARSALILGSISAAIGIGLIAGIVVGASATLSLAVAAVVGSMAVVAAGVSYMTGSMAAAMAVASGFAATGVGAIVAAIILVGIAITVGVLALNKRASVGQTLKADLDAALSRSVPLGLEALRAERAGLELREGFEDELPEYRGAEFGERLFAKVIEWTSVTPSGELVGKPVGLWTPNQTDDSDHRFRIVSTGEIVESITIRDGAEGVDGGEITARFDQGWMIVTRETGLESGFAMRFTDAEGELVEVSRVRGDASNPDGRFLITPIGEGVSPLGTTSDTIRFFDPNGEVVEVELVAPSANDPAKLRPTAVGPLTVGRSLPLRPNPVNAGGVAVPEDFASGWDFEWVVSRLDDQTGEPQDVHTATTYGTSFTPTERGQYRASVTMTEAVADPGPAVTALVLFEVTSPQLEITRLEVVDDGYFEAYLDLELSEGTPSDDLRVSVQWPGEIGSPPPDPVEHDIKCFGGGGLECTATMTLADRAALTTQLVDNTNIYEGVTVTVTNSTGGAVSRTLELDSTERPTLVAPPGGSADGTEFDPRRTYVEVEVGSNPLTEIARVLPGDFDAGLPLSLGIGEPGTNQSSSSITPLGGLLFVSLVEDPGTNEWVLAIKGQAEVSDLGLHRVPIVVSQSDATGPGRALHIIDLNIVPATGDRGRVILDNLIDPLGPPLASVPDLIPTIYGGVAGEPEYSGELCVRLVRAATAFLTPTICDDASRFVSTTGVLRFPFEELQPDGLVANSIYRASAWLTDTDKGSDTPYEVSFQVATSPPTVSPLVWDKANSKISVDFEPSDPDIPVTAVTCSLDGVPEPCEVGVGGISIPSLSEGTHVFQVVVRDMNGNYAAESIEIVGLGSTPDPTPTPQPAQKTGYWMLERDGDLHEFGDSAKYPMLSMGTGASAVSFDRSDDGDSLWVLDSNGGVHTRGSATHFGNADIGSLVAGDRVASISATPSGNGYWIFTDRGRVLTFGDAQFFDDLPGLGIVPNGLIVASAPTPSGNGYYMLGADGGVFAFGDAKFAGSIPGVLPPGALSCPIVGLVAAPSGDGYWMVACDGGVFAFGDAPFRGSIPGVLSAGQSLNSPINGLVPYGNGYLMVAGDGGVFTFSDKDFLGSLGSNPPSSPIVAITAFTS